MTRGEYVRDDKKRLHAEDKGMLVTAFLESFFTRYVEYDFTAGLEEDLDRVSNHEVDWKEILRRFWQEFSTALDGTKDLRVGQVLDSLNGILGPHIFPQRADGTDPRGCPSCKAGTLSLRLGKFGAFVGCSNYPECKYTRQLSAGGSDGEAAPVDGVRTLGKDPATDMDVTARDGRFGPYVQLGEGEKPKRQTLPKGLSASEVDLQTALLLLSLPREVARHPETGEPVLAGIGRYGPYVQHGKTYANIGREDDVLTIGGNRAIDLIIAKETGAGRFGRAPAEPARSLGDHPEGGPVTVHAGRYGPYVKHGAVNATLPKGTTAETVTLAQALGLIRTRAEAMPAKGRKAAGGKAAAAKPAASKAAAKAGAGKAGAKPKTAAKAKAGASPKGKTAVASKTAKPGKSATG